jgi:alanine-glyoxylate transaminase/serine-glyoxylate transaminase/serine-pyruvate transaminase
MNDRTTRIPGRRFLHSPGPTHLPDEVLDAMHRQPMDLADPRVSDNVVACENGLRRLLESESAEIVMYAANGHGAWEVVIENLLPVGASVLIPGTGHFSDSWAVQCEALGRRAVRTPWREGHPVDPQDIEDALRADTAREIVAVFVVQTDTASAVTSDVDALRAAVDASGHPALFVVDAVATLGAMPLRFDAQRIDVVVGASQKGLMLPPGIGFVAVGPAAAEVSRRNTSPRFYWDWTRRMGEQPYRKFCGTPPLNLLMGMEAGLKLLFAEGIAAVHHRHRLLSSAVHAAVAAWSEDGLGHQRRAAVDQAGVDLHQVGAGGDLGARVVAAHHAADADDREAGTERLRAVARMTRLLARAPARPTAPGLVGMRQAGHRVARQVVLVAITPSMCRGLQRRGDEP